MVSTTKWTLINLGNTFLDDVLYVHAITDVPCHLELCITPQRPDEHKHRTQKRGMDWYVDIKYCFVEYQCYEQMEAGDTLHHNWEIAGWVVCRPEWYIMRGTMSGIASPSNTPIFTRERQEGELPVLVINLGRFGDAETLVGEVKLEEGEGITITRNPANNSLTLAVTAAVLLTSWTGNLYDPSLESLDGWNLGFNQGSGAVSLTLDHMRLITGATNDSIAQAYVGHKGHGWLHHSLPSRVRFVFRVTGLAADIDRWLTMGLPTGGNNAYGFQSVGDVLYLYSRNGAGASVLGTGVTLVSGQIYRVEAEYTPGVGVQGYVDGVDVGSKGLDLPDADGHGLSMKQHVDATDGAELQILRAQAFHPAWSP